MKHIFKKFNFFGCKVYIMDKQTRIKKRQHRDLDMGTKKNRREYFLKHKMPIIDDRGGQCEMCGCKEHLNIHHILPYGRFPEFLNDTRNAMVVCPKCHKEIHDNPFIMCDMIRKKAEELNIDYLERYEQSFR